MTAHYDTYDYPSYWIGREYEHASEVYALKSLLEKIPEIKSVADLGAGYGRLTPFYIYRAKKIYLTDPSSKLLETAKKKYIKNKKINVIHSKLENLPGKIRKNSLDLAIMIRVLHHIPDTIQAFNVISTLIKPHGYLILEFPNKRHLKAVLSEFFQGNFTFPLDIFPKEVSTKKRRKKTIPFLNYHPEIIVHQLNECGFKIIEKRSISNIRIPYFKEIFPVSFLVSIEKHLQKPLSYLNFGPSIMLLAQKRD